MTTVLAPLTEAEAERSARVIIATEMAGHLHASLRETHRAQQSVPDDPYLAARVRLLRPLIDHFEARRREAEAP